MNNARLHSAIHVVPFVYLHGESRHTGGNMMVNPGFKQTKDLPLKGQPFKCQSQSRVL